MTDDAHLSLPTAEGPEHLKRPSSSAEAAHPSSGLCPPRLHVESEQKMMAALARQWVWLWISHVNAPRATLVGCTGPLTHVANDVLRPQWQISAHPSHPFLPSPHWANPLHLQQPLLSL